MFSLLVPTRGRPDSMKRFCDSAWSTALHPENVEIVFYIDADDTESLNYYETVKQDSRIKVVVGPRIFLAEAWNVLCRAATYDIIMQTGDDAVFRTQGWDKRVAEEFDKHPDKILLAFAKDGLQDGKIGTLNFAHKNWVKVVGYYMPPFFYSDYTDTWLTDVAKRVGRAVYMSDVFIEHLHPDAGKAEMDKTHQDRMKNVNQTDWGKIYRVLSFKRKEDANRLKAFIKSQGGKLSKWFS